MPECTARQAYRAAPYLILRHSLPVRTCLDLPLRHLLLLGICIKTRAAAHITESRIAAAAAAVWPSLPSDREANTHVHHSAHLQQERGADARDALHHSVMGGLWGVDRRGPVLGQPVHRDLSLDGSSRKLAGMEVLYREQWRLIRRGRSL